MSRQLFFLLLRNSYYLLLASFSFMGCTKTMSKLSSWFILFTVIDSAAFLHLSDFDTPLSLCDIYTDDEEQQAHKKYKVRVSYPRRQMQFCNNKSRAVQKKIGRNLCKCVVSDARKACKTAFTETTRYKFKLLYQSILYY